jgi:hypothetical protein
VAKIVFQSVADHLQRRKSLDSASPDSQCPRRPISSSIDRTEANFGIAQDVAIKSSTAQITRTDSTAQLLPCQNYRLYGASAGYLVYPIEQVEWAVRSVDFGFVLQNVELCHFKRIVPKNVLQAFESSDARSLDSVSKYPAQVVVGAVVAFESAIRRVAAE